MPTDRQKTQLDIVPDPAEVQRRLGEVLREERVLRRQLRLSLAAAEERRRRAAEKEVPVAS
jgi:hypothetical protein